MDSDLGPAKRSGAPGQALSERFTKTKQQTTAEAGGEPLAADQIIPGESQDDSITPQDNTEQGSSQAATSTKTSWRQKLKLHWPPGKKEWLVAAVLLLVGLLGVLYLTHHHAKKPPAVHIIAHIVKPKPATTVASTLTGLPVDPSTNKRPVTAVMIENSTDARPQSGLGQAGVVFEAIAEGGITRFLALYQDTAPGSVGPIRSARPYYLQWELGFDAAYAHVGGSPEALADIKAWGVRDLDQFGNGGSYQRISSRAAPHNVYTSIDRLNQLEAAKGYTTSTFTGFARKAAAPSKQPTARGINLTLSGALYNVHYDYDAATNTYKRSEAGAPHIDANTNTQISPTVVVALVMPYGLESDGHHSDYSTIGSGPAYVFQDGIATVGQWAKTGNTNQFVFTDAAGKPLLLDPGQTWLTAVSGTSKVGYAP
jgi:hypothetical protein